jgi:large subunit ribosomal protein L1|tara:strand:+ start:1176 stop:1817 length:642 start_codon:yes stop_codon:yes gene_type:complete
MDENSIKNALEELRKISTQRKFLQSIDVIITLKDIDMNKQGKIEDFVKLPSGKTKKAKICALVGNESEAGAKAADKVILSSDFEKWKNPREIKKLAREFDFFIAQADMMPKIAQIFGRYFGPINRMPNPKAGAIVSPKANLAPIVEKLRDTAKLMANKSPVFQCSVGYEDQKDEELISNVLKVVKSAEHVLPNGRNNLGKIYLKTTMSGKVKV